ncbi:DUF3592 domain-containing protein [Alteromonas flava]|uniref:DUF3592 domain-containing protein n=1 Tax=Alteromonas flava TaxID=2048003 RepID=UPI000C286530|nr:DUF3592 domain-containing protein [Alteromonas flava]
MEYIDTMWQLAANGERQGVLFFICLYCFVILGFSFYKQIRASQWPHTWGTLRKKGIRQFGAPEILPSDRDFVVDALYDYQVDGQPYQGKKVSAWVIVASYNARKLLDLQLRDVIFREDGKVKVFYHPQKPSNSLLIKPGRWGLLVTFLIATVPFIWYTYHFHLSS